jgi:hypothetical protein
MNRDEVLTDVSPGCTFAKFGRARGPSRATNRHLERFTFATKEDDALRTTTPTLRDRNDRLPVTRSPEQRKSDALAKLTAKDTNVWVASASPKGDVHLVPVTHTWNGSQVVLATGPKSSTVAHVTSNRRARLALGETRDVVMIDAVLVEAIPAADAPANLADAYAAQAGWDPRTDSDNYIYLVLGPERIQVWKEGEDSAGRTVMQNEQWVI